MSVWRGEMCPDRGPGLSHIQDIMRMPSGACVYCGTDLHAEPPQGVPQSASEAAPGERAAYAEVFDHKYIFTISGRCARSGCNYTKEQHAEYLIGVEAGDCTVDHTSVRPWAVCPICNVVVEPRMNTPVPKPEQAPMLMFTRRILDRLGRVHAGWMSGFFKS